MVGIPRGCGKLPVPGAARIANTTAGGSWDAEKGRATYRVTPDKEAPLWHPYTQVIYWWTGTEVEGGRAYRIAYNGYVLLVRKQAAAAYTACRCVKVP